MNIKDRINRHFKPGLRTNTFLSPEELQMAYDRGEVEVTETDSGLFLLRSRGDVKVLSFWLTELTLPEFPQGTVCELPSRPGKPDLELQNAFSDGGFKTVLSRVRLQRPAGEAEHIDTPVTVRLTYDADTALRLIKENFSPVTGCIPTVEELRSHRVYIAELQGEPVGVLETIPEKTALTIRHLAVSGKARGNRAAYALVETALREADFPRCAVWTGEDNAPALKNYARLGFRPDGYTSTVKEK